MIKCGKFVIKLWLEKKFSRQFYWLIKKFSEVKKICRHFLVARYFSPIFCRPNKIRHKKNWVDTFSGLLLANKVHLCWLMRGLEKLHLERVQKMSALWLPDRNIDSVKSVKKGWTNSGLYHMSCVRCHMPCAKCHMSPVACHMSYIFWDVAGSKKKWQV